MNGSYKYFNKEWFNKHQSKLLWLLRFRLFRYLLRIDCNETINRIEPNAYWFGAVYDGKEVTVKADFRTHDKYSKRLYYAFKPLWYAFHAWDKVANLFIPQWNLGFDTLTAYPAAGANSPVDGTIRHDYGAGSGQSWATLIAAAGTAADNTTATNNQIIAMQDDTSASGNWQQLKRSIFCFDTSSIGTGNTISDATLSIYGSGTPGVDNLSITPDINLYSANPASTSALVAGDYDSLGSTEFSTTISYASWANAYNAFVLNASGRSNIDKTGISKFGARNANYDVSGTPPTWSGSGNSSLLRCFMADNTGTTNDPKLVVTYLVQINPSVSDTATTGDTISIVTANLFNVANPQSQGVKIVNN